MPGCFYKSISLGWLLGHFVFLNTASATGFDEEQALRTFKKCVVCHEIGPESVNKVGPQLNGLNNRKAATVTGFRYSKAMKKAAETGLVWGHDRLDEFLKSPRTFLKGTRMSFKGLQSDDERENLVNWLLHFEVDGSELASTSLDVELLGASAAQLDGDVEYGEYLSGECVTCHSVTGQDKGIPAITGWPKPDFIHALYEYKKKARNNPAMQTVAARLGDEEMAALAAYFGAQ